MRINPDEMISKNLILMSEGNPGALEILTRVFVQAKYIDNDDVFGGLGPIMVLDHFEIYGSNINILANKICHGSLVHFLAVTRGLQLGILSKEEVLQAIEGKFFSKGQAFSLPFHRLMMEIRKKVPDFNKSY